MNINSSLFLQWIVFALLVWFTYAKVWPPIAKALDERRQKIADGLAAADKAKADLAAADKKVAQELSKVNAENAQRLGDAERRVASMIEEAKARAMQEGEKIIEAAKAEAQRQSVQAKEVLREQVAVLAIKGAEQILRKEVNPQVHADLLSRLKAEL